MAMISMLQVIYNDRDDFQPTIYLQQWLWLTLEFDCCDELIFSDPSIFKEIHSLSNWLDTSFMLDLLANDSYYHI